MGCNLSSGSYQGQGFQSFRSRVVIFYGIETKKLNKAMYYYWSHLNNPVKGFRSKTFPVPPLARTGIQLVDFSKH
jgi:hypothetical protein